MGRSELIFNSLDKDKLIFIMRHNQAQRGYLMVQAGLALALTGLATAAAVIAKQVSDDAASASAQADALTIVSQAVDALVMDSSNYAKYQAGLAITRNGVTIPFGSSLTGALLQDLLRLAWFFSLKETALVSPKRVSEFPVTVYL